MVKNERFYKYASVYNNLSIVIGNQSDKLEVENAIFTCSGASNGTQKHETMEVFVLKHFDSNKVH